MQFKFKDFGKLLKNTFKEWKEKDPFRQSAVIAYYAIFSLPALLVIIIAIAGFFMDKEAVSGNIHDQIASAMGSDTADQVENMVTEASETRNSTIATIIGIATLLFGATGVFVQLQKTLNIIWEVKGEKKKKGIITFLRTRIFSFGIILSIGFLLLISLIVTSMLTVMSDWLKSQLPDFILVIFFVLNFLLSLVIISVLFALMFKFLPDAKIKWRHVWVGAFVTGLLFVLGKFALGLYFGKAEPGSVYGAAGSIVLILLWVSYSSMILFFGAEFTRSYADLYEGKVAPTENAEHAPGRGKAEE
jgi:membrane protein